MLIILKKTQNFKDLKYFFLYHYYISNLGKNQ